MCAVQLHDDLVGKTADGRGDAAGGNSQLLRVNMANIRRKLEQNPAEPQYILTEIGVGYRMKEPG